MACHQSGVFLLVFRRFAIGVGFKTLPHCKYSSTRAPYSGTMTYAGHVVQIEIFNNNAALPEHLVDWAWAT